jgi:hypothetical protein
MGYKIMLHYMGLSSFPLNSKGFSVSLDFRRNELLRLTCLCLLPNAATNNIIVSLIFVQVAQSILRLRARQPGFASRKAQDLAVHHHIQTGSEFNPASSPASTGSSGASHVFTINIIINALVKSHVCITHN